MSFRPSPQSRRSVSLDCGDVEVTKQYYKDECDIHKILSQFQKTGIINHISQNQPRYLDLPESIDYQTSLDIVREAGEAFMTLSSGVRERYGNDPYRFLSALADPAQREYLESVGVFAPKKPAAPSSPSPGSPSPVAPAEGKKATGGEAAAGSS